MLRILTSACRRTGISDAHRAVSLGVAVLALGLTRCERGAASDDPPVAPAMLLGSERALHEVGERATARDYVMRVLRVQECGTEPYFKPDPGVRRLGIEVDFEGLSPRVVPVNPFYAVLATPDGERFEPSLAGCQPGLRASSVTQGQRASGWVSFDVPRSAPRLNLEYSPVVIGVGREELAFSVVR